MFEFTNLLRDSTATRPNGFPFGNAVFGVSLLQFSAPLINGRLKFERQVTFGALDYQVRLNTGEKFRGCFAAEDHKELRSVFGIALAVIVAVQGTAERLLKGLYDRKVRNPDADVKVHPGVRIFGVGESGDTDVALAVKQASRVTNIHKRASIEKWANSGDTQTGQSRAKQEMSQAFPGVCNEQVPTAKAKICSALHGNMQKSAEMTDSDNVFSNAIVRCQVTDGNTKYLHWRPHAARDMVPLSPNRRYAINQDAEVQILAWAGNLTCSGRKFQGRLFDNT